MHRLSAFVMGACLLVGGCGLFVDPQPDGSACEVHEDCLSETCAGGICAFSSCDDQSDCVSGFHCDEEPTWVEIVTFGTAKGTCVPSCDACPFRVEPRWTCDMGSDVCSYDGRPWVDPGGPYEGVLGETVRLSGSADVVDGRSVAEYRWELGGEVLGIGAEIDAHFDGAGDHTVSLVVVDSSDREGSETAMVQICAQLGDPCQYGGDCCALECRDDDGDGDAHCVEEAICGNGIREASEMCDGGIVPDLDCESLGDYHPGPVECSLSCAPNLDSCARCGTRFDGCSDDGDCCSGYVCDPMDQECRSQ